MSQSLWIGLCGMALPGAAPENEHAGEIETVSKQHITRVGEQSSSAGPDAYFTGRVRIDPVWPADNDINASGSLVTFEPGSRSAWHTHPAGQRLVVVSGIGLTQEWGKAV